MNAMKPNQRDPNRPRTVLVHPELHIQLARTARDEGYSIQARLHILLCREFGRSDLVEQAALTAAAS